METHINCPACNSTNIRAELTCVFQQCDAGGFEIVEGDTLFAHHPTPGAAMLCDDCEHEWRHDPAYTVILLYPYYAANDYGADIYSTFVNAIDARAAIEQAQREACADCIEVGAEDFDDFRPIAVFEGHHEIVADYASHAGLNVAHA